VFTLGMILRCDWVLHR